MLPNNPRVLLSTSLHRYHFLIAITIAVVLLIVEGLFLYRYFYQPLVSSKAIVELKQQAALEQPKLELFEKLNQFYTLRQKKVSIDWNTFRDPFVPFATPPSSQ